MSLEHSLFALIIGIDTYQLEKYSDLQGAARDADAIEELLRNSLGVSPSRIQNLRNGQATRNNIIAAFQSLGDNLAIQKDDPILIYFAGHGAQAYKPEAWMDWESSNSQIEFICPADMGCPNSDTPEEDAEISGIPDRTISLLLHELSLAKGDNITVVLDCCSAGGMNRASSDADGLTPRQISDPPPISADCDHKIWSKKDGARGAFVLEGFSGRHHESHILLAACGRAEAAYEDPRTKHGVFTAALLEVFERFTANELTYTSLMHHIQLPGGGRQTPHCEGQNVHRQLFNKMAPGADKAFILCWPQTDGTLILNAGAAQGLVSLSKFGAHSTNLLSKSNPRLGILLLVDVHPLYSVLSFDPKSRPLSLPSIFYAKQIERGPSKKFGLYSPDKEWLEGLFSYDDEDVMGLELLDKPDDADLRLTTRDGHVTFDRKDVLTDPYIGSHIPHLMDANDRQGIRDIVRSAIHYYYHLTRTGEDFRNVWMEFRELAPIYSSLWLSPKGPNYFDDEPAVITVDGLARRYGLTIFNQSELSLYPYLFYFDPSDLEIVEWYMSPFGAGIESYSTVDEPLPPKSKLTIGFGDGGASPWRFSLRDKESIDVGFFKLFLTTAPSNFAAIHQSSPFTSPRTRHMKIYHVTPAHIDLWGSKLITVVQKRGDV